MTRTPIRQRFCDQRLIALTVAMLMVVPASSRACSSCGCSLGTDWSDASLSIATGLKVDARFDFQDQDQLRIGRAPASGQSPPELDERQLGTVSRVTTLAADYASDLSWGVNVQIPFVTRAHESQPLDEAGPPLGTDSSSFDAAGDLRIVGRYQGFLPDQSLGLQMGLILPTGRIHEPFRTGPDAGTSIDRGLQPGTGTTNLLLGLYDYGVVGKRWDRFEQIQYRVAMDAREQFRPSPQLQMILGLRYIANPHFEPQLQLNLKWEGRETGAAADYENSGSMVVYVSPGASARLNHPLHVYGFIQLPVYQDYTGYQLAPRYLLSVGLSYRF